MNWDQELTVSALWLAKAYGLTCLLFVAACWGLASFTRWGRQFWALSGGYFSPRRSWRPLIGLALILLLTLAGVRLDVVLTNWSNGLYTALQKNDESLFWGFVRLFCLLASIHVFRTLLNAFISQSFGIHWREWLNEKLLHKLLQEQTYYRNQFLAQRIDNPDQRIQQDVTSFVQSSLSLSMGVVGSLVSVIAFSLILWDLSGPLTLAGLTIPHGMVFLAFAYVAVSTVFAFRIGRPLVKLNFFNEQLNANYRYSLVRLREYAESIAFYAGERVEGALLRSRFGQIISNNWQIVYRTLKFQGFNLIVSQAAVVFPLVIQAHRFFSKQITLGDLMQTSQVFGQLHDGLSFFRQAYDDFAGYRATLERLSGLTQSADQASALPRPNIAHDGQRLALEDFTLLSPAGVPLISALTLDVPEGEALLVRGRSGSGKTTLLRSLAGIWPYSRGKIIRPAEHTLFLSQRPYLPEGSLLDALYYPATPQPGGEARAREVLQLVQLGHLCDRLEQHDNWGVILSLGEQQRLAFGRLLLNQPRIAFLDEATSALDEGLEDAMYRLVRHQLPGTSLISVGHRSTLRQHHDRELEIGLDGRWQSQPLLS